MIPRRALLNLILFSSLLFQYFPVSTARVIEPPHPVISYNDETGMVSFVGSADGSPIPVPGTDRPGLQATDLTSAALSQYGPLFGIKDASRELRMMSKSAGQKDGQYTRYQQVYQGIPVLAGELIVNMSTMGLMSMSGEISPGLSLSTTPVITADEARARAVELAEARYGVQTGSLKVSEPALWIYDARLLKPSTRPAELVWRMEVRAEKGPLDLLVLVNAVHGGISLQFNQVDTDVTGRASDQKQATPTDPPIETITPEPTPVENGNQDFPTPEQPAEFGASGVNWYVAATGSDGNNCLTAMTPCASIQVAINKANTNDTIHIASGVYTGSVSDDNVVSIGKNITLMGGWNSNFTTHSGYTIIDGGNVHRGIYISSAGLVDVVIDRFEIRNCNALTTSLMNGGGIYAGESAILLIQNSAVHHNTGLYGGGIFAYYVANLRIINSTIGENNGDITKYGGGINAEEPTYVVINNSTIFGNSGGGFYQSGGTNWVNVQNTIIAGNSSRDCTGKIFSKGYNLIQNKTGCAFTPATGDLTDVSPQLGALTSQGYYPILPTSPVIDAGNPATPGSGGAACEAIDQLGTGRPIDGNLDGTAVCDIGAFETTAPGPSIPMTLAVVSGSNQITNLLHSFTSPLAVKVLDQYGVALTGLTVTFTAPDSGASVVFTDSVTNTTTAITNSSGVATSSGLTANSTEGAYAVSASVAGIIDPANFQLENIILAPTTAVLSSGSPQFTSINQAFTAPLKVLVKDQLGSAVPGVTVTFSGPSSGTGAVFSDTGTTTSTALTDSAGIATSSTLTANSVIGSYVVSATIFGISPSVDFQLANQGDTLYVSTTGSDGNDCLFAVTPCATINGAISKALTGKEVQVSAGTYTGSGTNPVVTINKNLTLSGGWNGGFTSQDGFSVIDSQYKNRRGVFVDIGVTTTLTRFIIQNARTGSASGAGILNNRGNLTLNWSAVFNNSNDVSGGGITNDAGTLKLNQSTVSGNSGWTGGGGIKNSQGTLILNNSTVSGNTALSNLYGASGGGINTWGTLILNNSTVSNNTAYHVGGIYEEYGSVTLKNTILSGNTSTKGIDPIADCKGIITSSGNNLIGDVTGCTFTPTTGDLTNVDPMLGSLIGMPGYRPLHPASPAIDAGDSCLTVDERNITRPSGSGCDIGAYEYTPPGAAAHIMVVSGNNQRGAPLTDFPLPLQAFVLDNAGSPVEGIKITFTAPLSGPSVNFAGTGTNTPEADTDGFGIATSPILTGNQISGPFSVYATTTGLGESAEFNLENIAWYVSPAGNDANTCLSPLSPCLKIDAPLSKPAFAAGDMIFVEQGTYTTNVSGSSVYVVTIAKDVVISGGWDSTFENQVGYSTIDGENLHTGVRINNYKVSLDHFIIQNGYTFEMGAGIRSTGSVSLSSMIIRDNVADPNTSGKGGGIYSSRPLILDRSAVYNNSARYGGGINTDGPLTILNSTIAGNIASTSNQASGGGIYTYTGTLAVNNSTIVDNMSSYVGGGIFGAATIGNSILSGNVANDSASECYYGTLTSQGNNIIGNTTGCTVSSLGSDKLNVDPDAFFIRDLGVAVLSHSSPAVDAGNPITCLAVDQRGVARSYDGDENGTAICDIGAFEYSGAGSTISFLLPIQSGRHYIKMENEDPLRFAVIAFDSLGNIVPGAMITFTAPTTGTSGTFGDSGNHATTAQTDGGGTATSARFTANTLPGIYTVQVTAAGAGTPIIFNMINGVGISIYSMNHQEEPPSSLPGSFVCDESQPGCTGGADLDADHAQTFAMDTYAFFIQHHGRNSLDGGGIPITASVHYGTNYDNAFWDDAQAVFGDDYVTDDIVAHELTHGVTEYTSGLLYYYQSGAISESFSDLWGEFVDLTNGPAGVSPSEKWLIGEDIGAFRNMANPPQFNDPDRMTSFYYHLGDLEDLVYVPFDNGGVHTNSGVNNKAVSLMTDGGSFNGYSVASLGIDKVAAIYYETQIHLLTSGAGYRDLYYAVHQACLNLIGSADGITLDDCGEVQKALESVEMNIDPITDFAPTASVCPNNAQPNNLFYDDFESGTGKWVLPAEWGVDSLYAASGQYSLYGLDSNVMTDTRATMSSSVAVPASGTTYLHFKQAFGFEINPDSGIIFRTWDGGVLEYQIDGGAWQDAGVLLDSGRGYNGQIYTGGGTNNPLAGRNAFVSDSHGYVSSRYNLGISAIRGHSIRFRWRIGTDQNTGELGWEIDDVRIYTCRITSPGTLLFLDDFSTAKGWTDNTLGGDVVRNATSQRLEWTARQSRALHYTIPIYATNDPIQLDFRFRVNSTQDTSLLWVGLANELNDLSPSVAGADLAGTFVGIDTSNKIQLMSLYPDRSYTQVDSAASTLTYNGQVTWQRAILTITGTDWTMVLKDDTGAEMGEMSGTLPRQQDHYDYLVLMYDSGTGDGFEGGYLDDIYVYGTARTSTFSDVPYGFWAHDWIERLFSAGITGGCGGGNYCPEQSVTRGQMAVFLERGMNSSSYTPPAETGTVFGDVPTSYWSASWVEKLFADGITGGCGGGNYCPDLAVSRAQMAVFLLRAKHGSSYTPPPATGVFPDVPTSYWAASWIEQLYAESITGGCGGGNYCPDQSVTRDQMAVFLVRTFNLP